MSMNEKPNLNIEEQTSQKVEVVEEMHLDDARRVKVQSPGMLVFRRFIRNKLAVIGLVILFFMFSFQTSSEEKGVMSPRVPKKTTPQMTIASVHSMRKAKAFLALFLK